VVDVTACFVDVAVVAVEVVKSMVVVEQLASPAQFPELLHTKCPPELPSRHLTEQVAAKGIPTQSAKLVWLIAIPPKSGMLSHLTSDMGSGPGAGSGTVSAVDGEEVRVVVVMLADDVDVVDVVDVNVVEFVVVLVVCVVEVTVVEVVGPPNNSR